MVMWEKDGFFEKTKKWAKKANYQNILIITYKNEPGKPCYRRVSRGYRRNATSPIKGIDTVIVHVFPLQQLDVVEMQLARLRALTHELLHFSHLVFRVEM